MATVGTMAYEAMKLVPKSPEEWAKFLAAGGAATVGYKVLKDKLDGPKRPDLGAMPQMQMMQMAPPAQMMPQMQPMMAPQAQMMAQTQPQMQPQMQPVMAPQPMMVESERPMPVDPSQQVDGL